MNSAILLLICSSFFHASWNSLFKKQKEKAPFLLLSVILAAVFSWILAYAIEGISFASYQGIIYILLASIAEGLYFFTLIRALDQASLALSYTIMRSLSMILSWTLSLLFFQEYFNLTILSGVILILLGLFLPAINKNSSKNHRLLWSYLCGICIMSYNFFYSFALKTGAGPFSIFALSLTLTIPLIAFSLKPNEKKCLKQIFYTEIKNILIVAILLTGSFSIYLQGLLHVPASLALTIRNSSIAFALIFSFFLGEKLKLKEWLTLFLILLGVLIVSLAK